MYGRRTDMREYKDGLDRMIDVGSRKPKLEDMRYYLYIPPRDGGYAFWDDLLMEVYLNNGAEGSMTQPGKITTHHYLFFPTLVLMANFMRKIRKSRCMSNYLVNADSHLIPREYKIHLYENPFRWWASKEAKKEIEMTRREEKI